MGMAIHYFKALLQHHREWLRKTELQYR